MLRGIRRIPARMLEKGRAMRFVDSFFNREHRYSLGVEEESSTP